MRSKYPQSQLKPDPQEYQATSENSMIIDDQKFPFKKYLVFAFANPRSGDGLAAGFLTEHPARTVTDVWFEDRQQSVTCDLRFFNVIEKTERENCLKQLEHACSHDDMTERKVVLIAGGDGSLATTVKFLRQSKIANQALIKGRISFVMLPFGTGNDGAQVFGWGISAEHEVWMQNLEELMRDIITS